MGQKINPIGLRLGINRTWDSRWFAGKNEYGKLLHEDMKIREELMKQLKQAAVSKIVIERPHKKCRVTIHSARPGVVIGKKGADIEKLRKTVAKLTDSDVVINIVEIRKPELDAQLVAESIAQQLERRVAFRRAMKRAVQSAMRLGAEGIRINCSGRLGGAEIARMEWYREGRVPLHTLRADIDYGVATAFTTYGTCGVKVWIFKGEILEHDPMAQDKKMAEGEPAAVRAATAAPKRNSRRSASHAATDAHQVPQGASRAASTARPTAGTTLEFRPVRPEGAGAGARHRAPDRGRAPRAHPPHEARRAASGSACSRTCRCRRSRSKCAWARARARRNSGSCRVKPGRILFEIDGVPLPTRQGSAGARRRQAADQDALRRAHRGVRSMAMKADRRPRA